MVVTFRCRRRRGSVWLEGLESAVAVEGFGEGGHLGAALLAVEIAQGPAGEHQAEDPADVQHEMGEQDEDGRQRIGAQIDQGQLAAARGRGVGQAGDDLGHARRCGGGRQGVIGGL